MQVHPASKPTALPWWRVLVFRLAVLAGFSVATSAAQASGLRVVESLGMSYLPNTTWVVHQSEPAVTFSMHDGTRIARFEMSFDGSAFHLKSLNDNELAFMPSLPWALCLYPLTGDIIPPGWDHSTSLGSIAWFDFPIKGGSSVEVSLPISAAVPEPASQGLAVTGALVAAAVARKLRNRQRSCCMG